MEDLLWDNFNPIKNEESYTRREFNLETILEFSRHHDVQIIRGDDWMYGCYINQNLYLTSITFLHALCAGINLYKETEQTNLILKRT